MYPDTDQDLLLRRKFNLLLLPDQHHHEFCSRQIVVDEIQLPRPPNKCHVMSYTEYPIESESIRRSSTFFT